MNSKMISMTFLVMVQFAPLVLAQNAPPPPTTFHKEIAPILFQHCAPCHRPGQSGPFSLLTYEDARKRATQIATVTRRRYMPPWLPQAGFGEFAGERRLSDAQIASIEEWARTGAQEGGAGRRPTIRALPSDWALGTP